MEKYDFALKLLEKTLPALTSELVAPGLSAEIEKFLDDVMPLGMERISAAQPQREAMSTQNE